MLIKLYTLEITRYDTPTTTYFVDPLKRKRAAEEAEEAKEEHITYREILVDLDTKYAEPALINNYTWDEIEYWYNPKEPNEITK